MPPALHSTSLPPFNPPPSSKGIVRRIGPERTPRAKLVIERVGREGRVVAAELIAGRICIERIGAEILQVFGFEMLEAYELVVTKQVTHDRTCRVS